MLAETSLLDYSNLFSLNDYKKNGTIICNYLKDEFVNSWILDLKNRWKNNKLSFTRNKTYDLMSEKYKKTCKYLNYIEHLLIFVTTITSWISISAFSVFVCVPFDIKSSAVLNF